MPLPNFLILGAPRAGTTSLYYWLAQHPDVFFSPIKEPHYFAIADGDRHHRAWCEPEFVRTRAQYEQLFIGSDRYSAIGEASTTYLQSPEAPARIADALGASRVRLIAIVRNPADRAFSHYLDHRSDGAETIGKFRDAWLDAPRRAAEQCRIDWDYLEPGQYAKHIDNYSHFIPRESLKIVLFEDFVQQPGDVLAQICDHIGVDSSFEFDTSVRYNSSHHLPANAFQAFAARRISSISKLIPSGVRTGMIEGVRSAVLRKPVLSDDDRAELISVYRSDIERLEEIIGRPLNHWLNPQLSD